MEIEIISKETIKLSSPIPDHLKTYKLCLLDQLAPSVFVPVILFYSSDEINSSNSSSSSRNMNHIEISTVLKKSLSDALTLFYPLAGKLKGNNSINCKDDGALYVEAQANTELSEILQNPDVNVLQQFLPLDIRFSNEDVPMITAVQVSILNCGSLAIGVCISHNIVDGASLATFLTFWSATAFGTAETITPFGSTSLFPPKDNAMNLPKWEKFKEKLVTKRFVFDATKLALLRAKVSGCGPYPTRVEAVTSLIWKSALAASREKTGKAAASTSSIVTHIVNIRGRVEPPLPEHSLGNLWEFSVATLFEEAGTGKVEVELQDLVDRLRQSIRKINGNYTRKLQGNDGISETRQLLKKLQELDVKGEMESYRFSSWTRFPFYSIDFGFGKPTWVCTTITTSLPMKNLVVLMGMKSGDGIEAWMTMTEDDMARFERDHELLEFTSSTPPSTIT